MTTSRSRFGKAHPQLVLVSRGPALETPGILTAARQALVACGLHGEYGATSWIPGNRGWGEIYAGRHDNGPPGELPATFYREFLARIACESCGPAGQRAARPPWGLKCARCFNPIEYPEPDNGARPC